jgi:hypothetical protein
VPIRESGQKITDVPIDNETKEAGPVVEALAFRPVRWRSTTKRLQPRIFRESSVPRLKPLWWDFTFTGLNAGAFTEKRESIS